MTAHVATVAGVARWLPLPLTSAPKDFVRDVATDLEHQGCPTEPAAEIAQLLLDLRDALTSGEPREDHHLAAAWAHTPEVRFPSISGMATLAWVGVDPARSEVDFLSGLLEGLNLIGEPAVHDLLTDSGDARVVRIRHRAELDDTTVAREVVHVVWWRGDDGAALVLTSSTDDLGASGALVEDLTLLASGVSGA